MQTVISYMWMSGPTVLNSDGAVFGSSVFGENLCTNNLPLPASTHLPGTNMQMPYYFVGDLMRPFPGRNLCIIKAVFNYRLSRARRVIENSFGILVARWRIFLRTIMNGPETADNIVKATVCLHNFIRRSQPTGERYCPPNYVDTDDVLGRWRREVENCQLQSLTRVGSNNATRTAINLRNNLAKYFVSKPGFKQGQIEYVKRV
jgi:hypothetical protein